MKKKLLAGLAVGYGQQQRSFSVEFVGTKSNGSTVQQSFTLNSDGLTPTLNQFSFGDEFTDLVQIDFRQGNFPWYGTAYQFNNVVVITTSPSPSHHASHGHRLSRSGRST